MKQLSFLLCSFLVLVHAAYAGEKTDLETQLSAQVDALSDAMVRADGDMLKKLTSPALTYGHSSGRLENQAEFIENIVNGNSNFLNIKLEKPSVAIVDGIGIARHILTGDTHDKGKEPGTVRIGVMLVWQHKNGVWLLLARQAYKLPK